MYLDLSQINIDDLSKLEKQRYQDAFIAFDKNGSKMIEQEELRKVLEEFGQNPTEEDLSRMINEVDSTGRGAVSFEDFLRIICYYKIQMANNDEEELKLIFKALGGDETSMTIQKSQLENALEENFALSIDLTRLLKENPSSQVISYEDFKNLLSN